MRQRRVGWPMSATAVFTAHKVTAGNGDAPPHRISSGCSPGYSRLRAGALLALLLIAFSSGRGQTKLHVDVDLVNVSATVSDQNGKFQADLRREDVTVLEDGVPQRIRFFSRESETSMTVGIVLDLSPSQRGLLSGDIDAAAAFVRRVIAPGDRVFIVAFGMETAFSMTSRVRLLTGLTSSAADLQWSLRNIESQYTHAPNLGPRSHAGNSPVRDAIYYAARNVLESEAGRKALILISDGEDTSSRQTTSSVIEMLQRTNVVLYALNTGHAAELDRPVHRKIGHYQPSELDRISMESGGQEFDLRRVGTAEALSQIEEQLRCMYSIGYVSPNSAPDGGYRRIEIRVNRPELKVRARRGYRARQGE